MRELSHNPNRHETEPPHCAEDAVAESATQIINVVGWQVVLPALGATVGWWCLVTVFLPWMGWGDVERIVQMGLHLRQESPSAEVSVAILGSSVVMDGVDCKLVQREIPWPSRVENLASSGSTSLEHLIKLPLILKTKPKFVVFGIDADDDVHSLPDDKQYAYSLGGFVEAWPAGTADDLPYGIGEKLSQIDGQSNWRKQLQFRYVPILWINNELRLQLRRDWQDKSNDWSAPYAINQPVTPAQLSRHLDMIGARRVRSRQTYWDNSPQLAMLAKQTREVGATAVFVIYPTHPDLLKETRSTNEILKWRVEKIAAEYDGIYINSERLLGREDFNDALHPSAAGREKWSRQIGQVISKRLSAENTKFDR